jgi:hypothetical protein
MSAIDKRISELQERLHKKRLLNQQLANQISAASHKAAYHQLVRWVSDESGGRVWGKVRFCRLTGSGEQTRKQPNSQPPNGLSRGNIAAVEPYNHVPLRSGQKNNNNNNNNVQETTTYHPVYQQNHHIKKDAELQSANGNQEGQDLVNKMANLYATRPEEGDALKEFAVSKSDPKYQTLPYNTKFTVNLLPNRITRNDNLDVDNKEDHISNVNVQSTHMTVHSAPLSMVNKNIATPLNQNDLMSKRQGGLDGGIVPNGVMYQVGVEFSACLSHLSWWWFFAETHQQRGPHVGAPLGDPVEHLSDVVDKGAAGGAADRQQASAVAAGAVAASVDQYSSERHPRGVGGQESETRLAPETGDKAAPTPDTELGRERPSAAAASANRTSGRLRYQTETSSRYSTT